METASRPTEGRGAFQLIMFPILSLPSPSCQSMSVMMDSIYRPPISSLSTITIVRFVSHVYPLCLHSNVDDVIIRGFQCNPCARTLSVQVEFVPALVPKHRLILII